MFGRRRKLSAALTPTLERDERVLAWAAVEDTAIVATNRGLWLPGSTERLGWHRIHKATWRDGVLTVTPSTSEAAEDADFAVVADTEPVTVVLTDPSELPKRVRERVTASVAYTSRHPLPGGGAARVVARRVSGRDGLSWSVRYEGDVDSADPAVASVAAELVATARTSL